MRTPLHQLLAGLVCAALCLCAPLAAPAQAPTPESEPTRLLKIVALTRHGVRAPTQKAKTLALWSTRAWPQWPVPQGWLTPRGGQLVTAMWEDLRGELLRLGILPEGVCPPPGRIFVRADVDQRTRATARALLEGLAPGCNRGYAVADTDPDPLFHPVKSGLYAFDPAQVAGEVLRMADGDLNQLRQEQNEALIQLEALSAPVSAEFCARFNLPPNCGLADIPNFVSVAAGGNGVKLAGGLHAAASLAEIFLLEYAQWPESNAGWGQVDAQTLRQLLPLRVRVFDVINRAPHVAKANGASLLNAMTAALLGKHPDQRCNAAALTVFVGHDTNITQVASLLGLTWQAPGYPDDMVPPGGVLLLELWERNGQREVRPRFFAQSLEALHAPFAAPLPPEALTPGATPPADPDRAHKAGEAVVSAPPVVGAARFSLEDFQTRVRTALKGAPLAPDTAPPLHWDETPPLPVPQPLDEAAVTP